MKNPKVSDQGKRRAGEKLNQLEDEGDDDDDDYDDDE
jgi:hypothetical protein